MSRNRTASFDLGVRNTAMCIAETVTDDRHCVVEFRRFDAGKNASGILACETLLTDFLKPYDWSRIKLVLIETQSARNVKAQLMAQTLRTWFSCYNIPWTQVAARLKTQVFLGADHRLSIGRYKRWSIEKAQTLLNGADGWTATKESRLTFEAMAKKDDAADALIQMAAFFLTRQA